MDYAGMASSIGGMIGTTVTQSIAPNIAYKVAKKEYGYLKTLTLRQMNADKAIAERNISLIQDQGMRNTELVSKKAGMIEGAQKATSAGMGIGGGSVTTANLLEDTRIQANLDKIAIRYGADLQSWKIQNQLNYDQWANQIKIDQYDYAVKTAKHNAKVSNMALGFSLMFGYAGITGNTAQAVTSNVSSGSQPKTQIAPSSSIFSNAQTLPSQNSSAYNQVPTYSKPASTTLTAGSMGRVNNSGINWVPSKLT